MVLVVLRQLSFVDVSFSALFFAEGTCDDTPAEAIRCGSFLLADSAGWRLIREIGYHIPRVFLLLTAAWLCWQICFVKNKVPTDIGTPFLGLISMLVGPAVITNFLLKEWWGRPRPFTTLDFGGGLPYVLPGDISAYCSSNCSFVSGEATAAFWCLWIVPFLPRRWRWTAGLSIFGFAVCVSLLRVAFGRHYFSDVVMGAMVALFAFAFSGWLLQTKPARRLIENWCAFSNRHVFNWFGSGNEKLNN